MMVVMHCSDFKDDEKSLGYSPENQVTTLNIDDYCYRHTLFPLFFPIFLTLFSPCSMHLCL